METKLENNIYIQRVRKELNYFTFFSLLAILTPFLALYIPYLPEKETTFTWFQRSGSAIVVFGLLAEARAVNCFFILNPSGYAEIGIEEAIKECGRYPTILNIISFILIACGTIVWGYGDIWVRNT